MADKKQKAKARAIEGGMPQNVADKVFKMAPGKPGKELNDNAFAYESEKVMAKLPGFTNGQNNGDSKDGEKFGPGISHNSPRDQHGNRISKFDPQFSYKISKKRQMEVFNRLSNDAKGGDISSMTNKPGTNEMWHPQTLSTTAKGSTHTDYNFTSSFKDAFKGARERHGAGGTFSWRGNTYNTKVSGE